MAQKCNICRCDMKDGIKYCENCGAMAGAIEPRTIDELKEYCRSRNMPTEKMRFFIGVNYKDPKAFGIYREVNGDFVVYKNKADGSRAIRYQGKDEAFAVRELFVRMQEEIGNQRTRTAQTRGAVRSYVNSNTRSSGTKKVKKRSSSTLVVTLIVVVILVIGAVFTAIRGSGAKTGYYRYNDKYYYNQRGSWYIYNGVWTPIIIDEELRDNYNAYYEDRYYDDSYDASDFYYSDYYEPYSSSSDDDYDYDSGSSWDYDDWDSGYTDWDSDW